MRYSPTTNGFYPEAIGYDLAALPPDLVDIDDEDWQALVSAQASGKMIMPGQGGQPVLVDIPPPDPAEARDIMRLTFAQLLIGLVAEGWISEAEGEAWLAGTLPAQVLAVIATLPAAQQFAARARAARPSIVARLDPLVGALAAAQGKSDAELDAFFAGYAAI